MYNYGIPANAHNGVVAGENAKVMTEEILKGFVTEVTQKYIDGIVDATWDCFDEYTPIEYDSYGNLWAVTFQFNEGSTERIWEDVEEMCNDEGYDIDLYDWCEENDISLDYMINEVAEQLVEDNDELEWFRMYGCDYVGVFYRTRAENLACEWMEKNDKKLKALVGDAESVDDLDVETCKKLVSLHESLFEVCYDESEDIDDALCCISYNANIGASARNYYDMKLKAKFNNL